MKPLFLSMYCPNDCDRKQSSVQTKYLLAYAPLVVGEVIENLSGIPLYNSPAQMDGDIDSIQQTFITDLYKYEVTVPSGEFPPITIVKLVDTVVYPHSKTP